ncbi:MAG: RnfH family protein [Nitrosomonadales bacterium SCN 54-20]|nr:MAG: RnfH family protein [Nitrosomonadales bacterium SCN 54-20]
MEVPDRNIDIEVVYALPEKQVVRRMNLPEGTTVEQAVKLSGILPQFPEIDLLKNRLGIYGRLVPPTTALCNRDRVEIYRPLRIDPKESRRKRAKSR